MAWQRWITSFPYLRMCEHSPSYSLKHPAQKVDARLEEMTLGCLFWVWPWRYQKSRGQHPRQPSINLQAHVFYIVSSISAVLPGIAGSGVYFKIKNTMVEVGDTEKTPFRASSQGSAHQRPWRQRQVDLVGGRALFCIALPTSLYEADLPQPPFSREGLKHLNFPSYSQRNTPVPYSWRGTLCGTVHLLGPGEGLNMVVSE